MDPVIDLIAKRGDLAHLALALWAMSATGLLVFALKEWVAAAKRFDAFINEIARLNHLFGDE
jgi:hypothetical protein